MKISEEKKELLEDMLLENCTGFNDGLTRMIIKDFVDRVEEYEEGMEPVSVYEFFDNEYQEILNEDLFFWLRKWYIKFYIKERRGKWI